MTKVVRCNCYSVYQDDTYGKGLRVANKVVTPPNSPAQFRCTVCGQVRSGDVAKKN